MRLDDNITQFGRLGTGAGGDRGRRERREEAQTHHHNNNRDKLHGRSVSLEPDHAAYHPPPFIDDIDSVSSFPPLRDDHQSTFVNSFSQFKRWPSHAPSPPKDPNPDHPLHKSISTPVFRESQMDDRSNPAVDLGEIRISDGEKLAAAASNLGYTNSFTKDRMLKMGTLPSPSPSPSTSPPLNPFRTVSGSSSSSESAETPKQGTPMSRPTHVVVGGVTCPMVRNLSLLRQERSSLNGKVKFIRT